jgi:hypothetical protein
MENQHVFGGKSSFGDKSSVVGKIAKQGGLVERQRNSGIHDSETLLMAEIPNRHINRNPSHGIPKGNTGLPE